MMMDVRRLTVSPLHTTSPLKNALLLAIGISFATLSSVQADALPGGASPGGILPETRMPADATPAAQVDDEAFPIPPVIERPLAVDEGPSVIVDRFQLEGVVDHPEQGISQAAVQALVDGLKDKHPQGFTIGQLQEVANAVTQYYRDAGYILAQAFIPAQEVANGVVTISVLEGKLGKINTEGNQRYNEATLTRPYAPLVGQAVTKQSLEAAVLNMTDYPGLSAFAVLQPGEAVGETDLVLKVQKEKPYDASVRVDNHGTEFIGEHRLLLTGHLNNPTRAGDRLSVNLLSTSKPRNTVYGDVFYQRPIISTDYLLGVGYARNDFDIGSTLASQGINGKSEIASVSVKRHFVRSRPLNIYATADLSGKRAELTTPGVKTEEDKLTVLSLEGAIDSIDTRFNGINLGSVTYSHGFKNVLGAMGSNDSDSTRDGGSPNHFAGGDFDKLVLRYSRWQTLAKNQALLFRFVGQHSNDLLTSLEQFQMGGPNSVRAYPVSEYLRDKGYLLSLEYVVNAPGFADKPAFKNRTWGEMLQVSAFVETSKGWINDPLPSDVIQDVRLSGAGVGVQFNLPGQLFARLTVATPIGSSIDPSNDRNPQTYFDFRYDF